MFKTSNICLGNSDYPADVKSKEGPAGQIPISITNIPDPSIDHSSLCMSLADFNMSMGSGGSFHGNAE